MPTSGQSEAVAGNPPSRGVWWHRWAFAACLATLGLVTRLRALNVGYISDDHWQLAMLRGTYGVERGPFGLFSFVRGDPEEFEALRRSGVLPWWASEDLAFNFMRPLSSFLIWVDAQLWPENPTLQHAHSLVWWAALLVVAGLLLWRLLPGPMAIVAGLIYVFDISSIYPVAWLANRSSLVATTFAALAFLLHLRWREDDWAGGRWLSALCFGLALSAGEYALPLLAFVGAYELFRAGPVRERVMAGLPVVGLGIAFVVIHRLLGFGTNLDAMYVDPFEAPGLWFQNVGFRWMQMWGLLSFGIPISNEAFVDRAGTLLDWAGLGHDAGSRAVHLLLAIAAIPGSLALAWGARGGLELAERRTMTWLGLAAAVALIPLTSVEAHSRLLQLPTLAAAGAWGAIVVAVGRGLADRMGRRSVAAAMSPFVALALWTHLAGDAWWSQYALDMLVKRSVEVKQQCRTPEMRAVDLDGKDVVLLNAWDKDIALLCGFEAELDGQRPRSWQTLGIVDGALIAKRGGGRRMRLQVVDGDPWLTHQNEFFCRAEADPIRRGDLIESGGMKVEVQALDADGHPTQIRVQFEDRLEDPRYVFVVFGPKGLTPVRPPAGKRPLVAPRLPTVPAGVKAR